MGKKTEGRVQNKRWFKLVYLTPSASRPKGRRVDTTLLVRNDHTPTPTLASAAVSIIDQDNKTQTPRFSSPLCPLSMGTLMQSFLRSHLVRLPSQSSTVNLPRYTVQTVHFERWQFIAHLKDSRVSSPYAKLGYLQHIPSPIPSHFHPDILSLPSLGSSTYSDIPRKKLKTS